MEFLSSPGYQTTTARHNTTVIVENVHGLGNWPGRDFPAGLNRQDLHKKHLKSLLGCEMTGRSQDIQVAAIMVVSGSWKGIFGGGARINNFRNWIRAFCWELCFFWSNDLLELTVSQVSGKLCYVRAQLTDHLFLCDKNPLRIVAWKSSLSQVVLDTVSLSTIPLFMISLSRSRPWSKYVKWSIADVNNSQVLNCALC